MRQRLLMFLKPHPIAHINIAAAECASEKIASLVERRTADALAHTVPRGLGSSIGMIAVMCSFYLNSYLLGAIAQAALKGTHVWPVCPRYHTCEHHRSVAFRAWRPFNFNGAEISDDAWHVCCSPKDKARARSSLSPMNAGVGTVI
jgi:hypothetical protein